MATDDFSPAHFFQAHPSVMPVHEVAELHLDWPQVRDLSPTPFVSLRGVDTFSALEALHLTQHRVESLDTLPSLPLLRRLIFAQNQLQSLAGIERCPQLTELDVSVNELSHLRLLAACQQLQVLHAEHNRLVSLEGVGELHELRWLGISGNATLHSLEGLEGAKCLETLYAIGCRLTDIGPLQSLAALRELHLTVWDHLPASLPAWIQRLHLRAKASLIELPAGLQLKALHLHQQSESLRISLGELPQLNALHLAKGKSFTLSTEALPMLQQIQLIQCELPADFPWEKMRQLRRIELRQTVLAEAHRQRLAVCCPEASIQVV